MKKIGYHKQNAFTLLELLVALAIFSVLSVMAYGSLRTVIDTKNSASEVSERLARVQLLMLRISNDLRQVALRQIRDEYGERQFVMQLHETGDNMLEWTRSGYMNPARISRSQLQRVAYRQQDNKLYRVSWPVLDRAQDSKPFESELIDGVVSLEWRFLKDDKEWLSSWPDENASAGRLPFPRAVEFNIELEDWGKLTRLVLLAETL